MNNRQYNLVQSILPNLGDLDSFDRGFIDAIVSSPEDTVLSEYQDTKLYEIYAKLDVLMNDKVKDLEPPKLCGRHADVIILDDIIPPPEDD